MTTQGAGGRDTRLVTGLNRDGEARVLDLLKAQYSDPAQVAYLIDRFGYRMMRTRHYSRQARVYFFTARIVVIGSGALLPAVVTLQSQSRGAAHTWLTTSSIVLSVLVAIAAGLLQTSRMGQRWKLHHWGWTELRKEGWALAERRGAYTDETAEARFATFVDRIEAVLDSFESALLPMIGDGGDEPARNPGAMLGNNVVQLP
jgi:hypothetical protein